MTPKHQATEESLIFRIGTRERPAIQRLKRAVNQRIVSVGLIEIVVSHRLIVVPVLYLALDSDTSGMSSLHDSVS